MKLVLPLLLLFSVPLTAQVFMRPLENAANLGMGSAAVANPMTENGISNAAQLGQSPKLGVRLSTALPFAIQGWQSHGFLAMGRIGKNQGVALDVLHSGIEGYREQRFSLHYGRRLGERFMLGGSLHALRMSADEFGNQSAATFSVGLLARIRPKCWIAAHVQNPVPQSVGSATIGNLLRIGINWQPSEKLMVSSEMEKDLERPVQIKAGLEYRPLQLLRIRAGIRTYPARASFGAGLCFKENLFLDFASEWHPTLGVTPAASVYYRLNTRSQADLPAK